MERGWDMHHIRVGRGNNGYGVPLCSTQAIFLDSRLASLKCTHQSIESAQEAVEKIQQHLAIHVEAVEGNHTVLCERS